MANRLVLGLAVAVFLVAASLVHAAVEPGPKCKDAKIKAAGLKAFTLMKALGKNIKKTDPGKLSSDVSKVQSRYMKGFSKAEDKGGCETTGDSGDVEAAVDDCVTQLVTLIVDGAVPGVVCDFPATGQTSCWDSTGTPVSCSGTGHDGDIEAGAPLAYMDNDDGTVTDLNTGLMWEKKSDDDSIHDKDTTYTWAQAFTTHVAGLNGANFAGHSDWRVPNYKELVSILDLEMNSPAVGPVFNTGCEVPGCSVLTCSCTITGSNIYYWSSTSLASSPAFAWALNFTTGDPAGRDKDALSHHVRAVRGGL